MSDDIFVNKLSRYLYEKNKKNCLQRILLSIGNHTTHCLQVKKGTYSVKNTIVQRGASFYKNIQ